MMAGAELAFAEPRSQGSVNGRKVRIVSIDNELKPERAVANCEKSCWAPTTCSASSAAWVPERRPLQPR
jgi:hypothetical protein